MNELNMRLVNDFLPYLKPSARDEHAKWVAKQVKRFGDIVRIEEVRNVYDGSLLQRKYHYADRGYAVLSAARAGVKSLAEVDEAVPA
ncbi:MAG: hypothetical protein LBU70_02550 [Chitinispirillales bacterium]|jgi:hypothetical protein|nr:hypothetical protein [Chitinispirillales bacterium]